VTKAQVVTAKTSLDTIT